MKSIVISIIAILCLFASSMHAQEIVPFGGNSKQPFLNENIKQREVLNFFVPDMTPEQRMEIEALILAKNKQIIQLDNRLNEKQTQLQTLESSAKPNLKSINKIIDEIGKLFVSRMKTEAACTQKIRSLLTEKQRIEFDLKK